MDLSHLVNVDMTGALTDKPAGKTLEELPLPLEDMLKLHADWLSSEKLEGSKARLRRI